jgi:hypothetical protein
MRRLLVYARAALRWQRGQGKERAGGPEEGTRNRTYNLPWHVVGGEGASSVRLEGGRPPRPRSRSQWSRVGKPARPHTSQ